MKQVELYAKVRYAVQIEGLSNRAAAAVRDRSEDGRQDDTVLGAAASVLLSARHQQRHAGHALLRALRLAMPSLPSQQPQPVPKHLTTDNLTSNSQRAVRPPH